MKEQQHAVLSPPVSMFTLIGLLNVPKKLLPIQANGKDKALSRRLIPFKRCRSEGGHLQIMASMISELSQTDVGCRRNALKASCIIDSSPKPINKDPYANHQAWAQPCLDMNLNPGSCQCGQPIICGHSTPRPAAAHMHSPLICAVAGRGLPWMPMTDCPQWQLPSSRAHVGSDPCLNPSELIPTSHTWHKLCKFLLSWPKIELCVAQVGTTLLNKKMASFRMTALCKAIGPWLVHDIGHPSSSAVQENMGNNIKINSGTYANCMYK